MEKDASDINLLILDVDGVMTDGRIILNDQGEEWKSFHAKDGHGIKMLLENGTEVVIISGRRSKAVEHRARELGIREVYLGIKDKAYLCEEIIERKGLKKANVCSVGDDLPDLALFALSGISFAVADAAPELRSMATFVTKNIGGQGAVREVCEWILKGKGRWPDYQGT